MLKGRKYRIYPDKSQKDLLNKHINNCRFIYNLSLETKISAYLGNKFIYSSFDLIKQLPELKKEFIWLKETNSQSLQQSIINMDIAYKRFYSGSGFPKFKSKKHKQSFQIPQRIKIQDNKLIIPNFKEGIKIILHRPINGIIKNVTITLTSSGKYYASILIEDNKILPNKSKIDKNNTIGIDLGLKSFVVTSKSDIYLYNEFLRKAQLKLKFLQSKYSKYKGKNTKQKIAILHEKVMNQRKDFLHKLSTKLISENQTICLENLGIKNMIKNHNLALSITDVSWGTFINMLEYKANWYGKNIIKIDKFAPSSKTCSNCGIINNNLTLNDRKWRCNCGSLHERDINAAINIKNFGLNIKLSTEHRQKIKKSCLQ